MTLVEAMLYADSLDIEPAEKASLIVALFTKRLEVCNECGYTKYPNEICSVCENAWADQQAALEEEHSWAYADLLYAEY